MEGERGRKREKEREREMEGRRGGESLLLLFTAHHCVYYVVDIHFVGKWRSVYTH